MQLTDITERLLNDAGGWQTMKQARALHEMGRVSEAAWEAPLLQGRVREGDKEYRSGLKIQSKTNIENLCGCRDSRQRGMICAHSIAVGLELLKPHQPKTSTPVAAASAAAAAKPQPVKTAGPRFSITEGDPIELSVILPPNLAPAVEKNSIMLGVEATAGGKHLLLAALPKNGAYRCSETELRMIETLRSLADGELPGMAMLNREQFAKMLTAMAGHPHVTLGKSSAIAIRAEPLCPPLEIEQRPDGSARLKARLPEGASVLVAAAHCWLLTAREIRPVAPGLSPAYQDLLRKEVVLPPGQSAAFLSRELPALHSSFLFADPEISSEAESAVPASAKAAFFLHLEGSLNHLVGRLEVRYGEHAPFYLPARGVRATYSRDHGAERSAVDRLRKAGFGDPDPHGQMILKGEPRILAFFARELPWWERHHQVEIGARFQHVTREVDRVQPQLEVRGSGENWFELQVELATGSGERFSASEIQRLIQSGQSHVRRKNGRIAVFDPGMLDEFQQVLQDCDPQQRQPGLYRIDRRHAAYLESVADEQGASMQTPANWRAWAGAPRQQEALEAIPLGSLDSVLRPYQKQGVYWLNFLARNGLGGILADEMGLGKTLQALALIRAMSGKALIVCPSSLVYNWQREAERFTPDRKVLAIEGPRRQELFGKPLAEADLVITSYPLLRRDADQYRPFDFTAAVLDEAQHIKNPDSQNAQSAFSIRAKHRFVLTGTPVENSVRDLWALMNFVMPGYLGSRNDFRDRYELPINSQPGGPEHSRLVKRIKPFVLRRLKKNVITDLPEKIEQVSYCELTDAQSEIYAELLTATRRQVADLAGEKDQKKARMVMLTALLRLRQACCDLRLLKLEGSEDKPPTENSSKIAMLGELLEEAVDGGHRVLVFSQFATMLGHLQDWLKEAEIDTCYLDGSTKDRAAQVDRFQRGDVPVFLISLKAGGVGLNLTAADTVVHFDPWWNPAVEAQATDRAHRIGQKKAVSVYKLITRGTVEEKILALQTRKREVIDATIDSEQPMMQGLTMSDIEELLR